MHTRVTLVGVFIVAAVLAGCGARQPAATGKATPTPTALPIPTVSYAEAAAACKGLPSISSGTGPTLYRLGELLVSAGSYAGIASRKLPDNTALAPLSMPDPNDQAALAARFPPAPLVNPIGMGVYFAICNASKTRSHEIEGVTMRIQQFTPYAGRVQTWTECDGYYTRSDPHGVVGGGCGYGVHADETVKVTFPANAATGAVFVATWTSASDAPTDSSRTAPLGPLPAMLPPGQMMGLLVTGAPTTTGTYALEVAPTVDHTRLSFTPVGVPALFAASPQKWTGEACLAPAMQQQIPAATTPPSYYICPQQ